MKKFGIFLMAFLIVFCTLSPLNASAALFSDVKIYEAEIGYLTGKEIINGYPDGKFLPDAELTRLQGVRVLLKAKGVKNLDAPNPKLTDMPPGSHGYAEVAKAVQLGIISGKIAKDGSKYFDPAGKLTRGQMAKIIVKTMGYKVDNSYSFRDVSASSGYYNDVSAFAAERITEGYEDRTFKPNNTVSRQHFAVFVARMLNDKFKPKPRATSYLMDKTKDYSWQYIDNGKVYLSTISYIGQELSENTTWDLWKEIESNGKVGHFLAREDQAGLYHGYQESYYNIELAYPLYNGKKFDDWTTSDTYTIVSLTQVVTTKAGTFRNVVEVKATDGWTYYYAPNIGHIKSVEKGKVFSELMKLTQR